MDHSTERPARSGPRALRSMPCGLPENFPACVAIVARDGRIAYASGKFADLLGTTREEVIGQNLSRCLAENQPDCGLDAILGEETLSDVSVVLQHPIGAEFAVSLSAEHWLDPDGRRYRILHISQGIEPGEAEQADRLKSFRLQSCIEGTNAGTWEWNVQTGETRFNDRWAEIVGYTLEDLEPVSIDTWESLAHPDDFSQSADRLKRHFEGKDDFYQVDARMRHKDGHYVWVRDRGRVFTWTEDGKPEWMFGTHFLIDVEKKSYDAMKARHSLLERVANLSGVGAWEVDIKANTVYWSDQTKRIHSVSDDYEPSIAEGINFYAPEARPIISAAVEEGMKSGRSWDLELPLIRQNGQRIWVRAVGKVEFDGDEPVQIIGSFQEITAQVHDRNELIAAKEWTAFAAEKGRVGLWSLDTVLGELNWDEQMTSYFGFPAGQAPGTVAEWLKSLTDESGRQLKTAIRDSIFSEADIDLDLLLDLGDGKQKVLRLVGAPHLDQENAVDRLQGACFDLTEHRQLTARFEEQASKLSVTLSSIGDGVITTDETGRVTWMNPEAEKILGRSTAEVEGLQSSDVLRITNDKTGQAVPCPIQRCLKKRATVVLEPDSILLRPDGTEVAIEDSVAPLVNSENRTIGAVMVFRDTSAQRLQRRETAFRATHDSLTGLLNREAFLGQLEACLANPVARNGSYLYFVDLDHFKRINDSFGHGAGDAVLACIADVLRESVDDSAAVSRIGGDEFAILLRARTQQQAEAIGQDICRRAANSKCLKRSTDVKLSVGTSVGIVGLASKTITAAEALRMADIAAYSAKNNGRGQARFWDERDTDMTAMSRQTSLLGLIEAALRDGSWVVQEQCINSIDDIDNGEAFAELLIRLPDGSGGTIPPGDFLPAAERYGLMQDIDLWMCSHALDRIGAVVEAGSNKLYSVNMSASSIGSESFKHRVLELLTDVPAEIVRQLCFEVTETAILKNYDACRIFLADLRALGASIAIDDFGAGSTSFRHFQNLPADYLKIEGSFIRNMDNPVEAACIECFLKMAKVANFKTIAEHVEDEDQIAALANLDVDFLQGFALGRPR